MSEGNVAEPGLPVDDEPLEVEGEVGGETPSGGAETPQEETFYDATKVPEGLRATFKEMQAAFTQKTQTAADLRKQAEQVTYKAQILDQLLQNQQVVSFLQDLQEGKVDETGEEVDPNVASIVDRRMAPVQAQLQAMQVRLQIEQERIDFIGKHPDWEQYKDGMKQVWAENPASNLTMEQAYKIAKADVLERQQADRQKRQTVVRSGVETPATQRKTTGAGTVPKTVEEAAEMALKELGISRQEYMRDS